MRRRARAQAVADDLGYGRYVRFASPSYAAASNFFFLGLAPLALGGTGVGFVRMAEHRASMLSLTHIVIPPCGWPWHVRRQGY
jgi:hypothetical protein